MTGVSLQRDSVQSPTMTTRAFIRLLAYVCAAIALAVLVITVKSLYGNFQKRRCSCRMAMPGCRKRSCRERWRRGHSEEKFDSLDQQAAKVRMQEKDAIATLWLLVPRCQVRWEQC